ncbi:MAG: MurR/RpiR family transcriptional regulator [Atopobiaceae bacterium]|nr:MurR/RpiR family transcriptional regulator [Atopobiaceae bacterium]
MQLSTLIGIHYRELTDNELLVCRFLLHNIDESTSMTVGEVAQACHVSNALVTRFAQKLGFSGFSELRAYLRLEASPRSSEAHSLMKHATDSYQHLIDNMLGHDFTDTFGRLLSSERVLIYGDSDSMQNVAGEARRIFMPLVQILEARSVEQCRALCTSAASCFLIVLTDSDNRPDTEALVRILKAQGTFVLCVSSMRSGECAMLASDSLFVGTTRVTTHLGMTFEGIAPYLLTFEMMYLSLRSHISRTLDIVS